MDYFSFRLKERDAHGWTDHDRVGPEFDGAHIAWHCQVETLGGEFDGRRKVERI